MTDDGNKYKHGSNYIQVFSKLLYYEQITIIRPQLDIDNNIEPHYNINNRMMTETSNGYLAT